MQLNRGHVILGGIGIVVIGALLYGGGYFTGRALVASDEPLAADSQSLPSPNDNSDDGENVSNREDSDSPSTSGSRTVGGAPVISTRDGEDDVAFGEFGGFGGAIGLEFGCRSSLPPIFSGSNIDLSLASVDLRLLGDRFVLRSLNIYAESDCSEEGSGTVGTPVVESGWFNSDLGIEIHVTQRVLEEPVTNVVSPFNGQVWDDGYVLTVWANVYFAYGPDDIIVNEEIVRQPDSVSAPDEGDTEVIRWVLGLLAPSVDGACYYEQARGTWADLAAMGVGDPRPAIPIGLQEQYAEFTVFKAPPADCNVPEIEVDGNFNATFSNVDDGKESTWVDVSAYPVSPGGYENFGYLDEDGAFWSNGSHHFNVSGWREDGPLGRDTIEAIALAMDPAFGSACFIRNRELTDSDLAEFGLSAPVVPDGWFLVESTLNVSEAPGGSCDDLPDAEFFPQLNLFWIFEGEGIVIEAIANRYGTTEAKRSGFIYENGLNWTKDDGTIFDVSGYEQRNEGGIDIEILIAIALSMDPTLDVDELEEDSIAIPLDDGPLPPDEDMDDVTGGGATGPGVEVAE